MLTLVTAFYILPRAKFQKESYIIWLNNLLNVVAACPYIKLVIYTDQHTMQYIGFVFKHVGDKVQIRRRSMEEFYMYKYADKWRLNHEGNTLLKTTTAWELNMLWHEKLWFVRSTIYEDHGRDRDRDRDTVTPYYAWCDAGYFRNRDGRAVPIKERDVHTGNDGVAYRNWASPARIARLDPTKIYYNLVQPAGPYLAKLRTLIMNKDADTGVPIVPIPHNQTSIGGGFCLLAADKIDLWCDMFDKKVATYFKAGCVIKDDQIILADCIFSSEPSQFFLVNEPPSAPYDPWFVFQRFLF